MGLTDQLRRLRKEAGGAVLRLDEHGSTRAFTEQQVLREMFLAWCDLIKGQPPKDSSGVISAVLAATPESRQRFDQSFGRVVGMEVRIISADWVDAYALRADGTVERTRHEGEEAERMRQEARQHVGHGSFA